MKNEALVRRMATSRIDTLLGLAEAKTLEHTDFGRRLSRRYVGLVRKISSHYKVPIPGMLKRRICKNCGNFLVPGINCKVVVASVHGYVAYVCECGSEAHVSYIKKPLLKKASQRRS